MNIFSGFDYNFSPSIVTVGSFDGVHKGHKLLISQLNAKGDELNLEPIIVTFDPHPRSVLKGNNRLLSTIDEKLFLLEKAGARNVVVINFTKEFAQTTAEQFIEHYILDKLQSKAVFMGEGHFFGKDKGGSSEVLNGYALDVYHVDRLENISSTAIRAAIEGGDMATANRLLDGGYLTITPVKNREKLLPQSGHYQCINQNKEHFTLSVENIRATAQQGYLFLVK